MVLADLLHVTTETDAVPKAETATARVDRMVHHRHVTTRDVMTIVEGRRTNALVEDQTYVRTWIAAVDRPKVDTNFTKPVKVETVVASLANVAGRRFIEARGEETLGLRDLRCVVDVLRSLVGDQAGLRGLRAENLVHRLAVVHRSVEDLRKWDHPG